MVCHRFVPFWLLLPMLSCFFPPSTPSSVRYPVCFARVSLCVCVCSRTDFKYCSNQMYFFVYSWAYFDCCAVLSNMRWSGWWTRPRRRWTKTIVYTQTAEMKWSERRIVLKHFDWVSSRATATVEWDPEVGLFFNGNDWVCVAFYFLVSVTIHAFGHMICCHNFQFSFVWIFKGFTYANWDWNIVAW